MLHGRRRERAAIDNLVGNAVAARGGGLLLRGEPGVGKTSLLTEAAQHPDVDVLRAVGSRHESALPFAHLQQLLQPLLGGIEVLPPRQAHALRAALGLGEADDPDRFMVAMGALTLLASAAATRPVVCLLDDVQWFDAESLDTVRFVLRRIDRERIAFLAALTELPVGAIELPVDEVTVAPLDRVSSDALVIERCGLAGRSVNVGSAGREPAPEVRAALWATSGGNPLALIEMVDQLSVDQLTGERALPDGAAATTTLHEALLARARRLPPQTQDLLLIAAAEDAGDLGCVVRAGRALGIDPAALDAAEFARVVATADGRVTFCHPLMRTAIYQSAPFGRRQLVHRALAAALAGTDPDRQAWQSSKAAVAPDDAVADQLDRVADRARARGGHAAAALALQRASDLTRDTAEAGRRMVAAAGEAWAAGRPAQCRALLERADPLVDEMATRADAERLRAAVESVSGSRREGVQILLDAADAVAEADPGRAIGLLVDAGHLAWSDADVAGLNVVARRLRRDAVDPSGRASFSVSVIVGLGDVLGGNPARGLPMISRALQIADPADPFELHVAGTAAMFVGDDRTALDLLSRASTRLRRAGLFSRLPHTIANLASLEAFNGHLAVAQSLAAEGASTARETDQPQHVAACLGTLAWIAAVQGRDQDARAAADEASALAARHRIRRPIAQAAWAAALRDLGAGRWLDAITPLEALASPDSAYFHPMVAVLSSGDLMEAAHRLGRDEVGRVALGRLEAFVDRTGTGWAAAVVARSRALFGTEAAATESFELAAQRHSTSNRPFEEARTQLLFGEHLRRARRRSDARAQLRLAIAGFERLGARPWEERAHAELRATGETARKREPSALSSLTPQQLQIVRLVTDGMSNKDVAAHLFLSPRTVDYHLRNVFTTLGITSRAELNRVPGLPGGELPA